MSVAADTLLSRFWAVMDEVRLMDLKPREEVIFSRVLQEQVRRRVAWVPITQRQDLYALTLIDPQNLTEPVRRLQGLGMLNVMETNTGWGYQAVTDASLWDWKEGRTGIDRRVYYGDLARLRGHVGREPELHLEINFAPTRSAQEAEVDAESKAASECDYHQDRGNGTNVVPFQGDSGASNGPASSESARVNAVQKSTDEVAVKGAGGPASEVGSGPSAILRGQAAHGPLAPGELRKAEAASQSGRNLAGPHVPRESSRRLWSAVEAVISNGEATEAVLDLSTGEVDEVRSRDGTVLKLSTAVLKSSTAPPGRAGLEYSNLVPASGGVLKSSTDPALHMHMHECNDLNQSNALHAGAASKGTPDGTSNCTSDVSAARSAFAGFVGRVGRGEMDLPRGASPAQLYAWLSETKAFADGYWAKEWADRCNRMPRAVENAFLTAVERERVYPGKIKRLGGFLTRLLQGDGHLGARRE